MSTTVFVYTMNRTGEVGAWSRYVWPFHVDNFCQHEGELFIRAGNDVLVVDEDAVFDFAGDERQIPFDGIIQWPYLDFGQPGVKKAFAGVDVSTINAVNVDIEVGYNQNDPSAFTAPYSIPGDTVPGMIVPIPLVAESFSLRLTLSSFDRWKLQAVTVYFNDQRVGA